MSDVKTYLGQKGYTIYKDKISIKEQQWIRDELMVSPFIPKSILGYGAVQKFRHPHHPAGTGVRPRADQCTGQRLRRRGDDPGHQGAPVHRTA